MTTYIGGPTWAFYRAHYWTPESQDGGDLENRNDVIFLPMGSSMWTKFGRLVQNDMPTAVMWTKSKTEVALQAPRNQNNFMALALRAALTI